MTKSKMFYAMGYDDLEAKINTWLAIHPNIVIVSASHAVFSIETSPGLPKNHVEMHISALVIYSSVNKPPVTVI